MNPNDLAASRPSLAAAPDSSGAARVAPDATLHFLRKDDVPADTNGIGVVNAFVVVLLLAGLAFWILRRGGFARLGAPRAGPGAWPRLLRLPEGAGLKVLQSTRLTQKASAHVLEWEHRRWLVVCNDGSTTVVASQAGDAPAATDGTPAEDAR